MRLGPSFRRFAGHLVAAAVLSAPVIAAVAAGFSTGVAAPGAALGAGTGPSDAPETRILSVGATGSARVAASGLAPEALIALDRLPQNGGIEAALYGARLRATPVTTFPDTRAPVPADFEEFFLVIHAELGEGDTGARLTLGGEALTIPGFGLRLASTAEAFAARYRRALFLDIADPDDTFAAAMPALRAALDPLGFDLQVVTISEPGAGTEAASGGCAGAQALPVSLATGLADRVPFGDGNGTTTQAEAEAYLGAALTRAVDRGCGPAYSLIFKPENDPAAPIVTRPLGPGSTVEDQLAREGFEAMFLDGSANVAALDDYLANCTYCPGEARLGARLADMSARARLAALEDEMWDEIRDDDDRARLAIYVDHCTLCLHSDAALTRIERLDAETEARAREQRAFIRARDTHDLAGLRAYLESCTACAEAEDAAALIAEMEADADYMAERAALAMALEGAGAARGTAALEDYLAQCRYCDGAAEARAAIDRLAELDALTAPCLAVAGLPQMGGPRKLEDIDQSAARAACGAAAGAFPEDGLIRVIAGRIAQAAGDDAAAAEAYAYGMDHGVPAAYGLAAYAAYAPADGGPIDPERVEALALAGAEAGDWLSQEVLSVLYSKDLVAGKSGPDAFAVAMAIAEAGDPIAQFFVGHYYLTGVGTAPSPEDAAVWLARAVSGGYTHASAFLAGVYETGAGDLARPERAAELLWTALGRGDAAATDRLTTALAERSAEVVRIIQGKLREQGLYQGAVDGVPGQGTEAAIRAYVDSLGGQG